MQESDLVSIEERMQNPLTKDIARLIAEVRSYLASGKKIEDVVGAPAALSVSQPSDTVKLTAAK